MDGKKVYKRGGRPNAGGGRQNKRGGGRGSARGGNRGGGRGGGRGDGRGRGRGRGADRGQPQGRRGGGGWSASRKGGMDFDDSYDGPVVNNPYEDEEEDYYSRPSQSASSRPSQQSASSRPSQQSAPPKARPKVKVEMQRLHMTADNQEMVREMLESLRSDDDPELSEDVDENTWNDEMNEDECDELDYRTDNQMWSTRVPDATGQTYTPRVPLVPAAEGQKYSSPYKTEQQYWMNDSRLVVEEVQTFTTNLFGLKKLQRCGFNTDLCNEALQLCDGDVGSALEYLLNELYGINMSAPDDEEDDASNVYDAEEISSAREDEKLALQSMYDKGFVEKIPGKVWTLSLESAPLLQLIEKISMKSQKRAESRKKEGGKKSGSEKKICPFFLKGKCKFKDRCNLSHTRPEDRKMAPNDLSHPMYDKMKSEESGPASFTLEIRFTDGNKYPYQAPLIAFSSTVEAFPGYSRLNVAKHLMSLATESAEQHLPCVFSLVSALEDAEKLKELLSLPPPMAKPLGMATFSKGSPRETAEDYEQRGSGGKFVEDKESTSRESVEVEPAVGPVGDSLSKLKLRKKDSESFKVDAREQKRQNKLIQLDFKKKQTSKNYQSMMTARQKLPAWDMRDLITEVIADNQVVVICGMTGCGKTTQVPQFILDEALQGGEFAANIVCTQPRRISAMAVAQRVADERCEKLGKCVGYKIRLENVMSIQTRLLFCTTGIILRRLESDPHLKDVTHIIIDEVHERSEESDFLLMILRNVLEFRPDLKVILMSATLDARLFSDYFNGCAVLEIPGRTFPVQQFFLEDIIEFTRYKIEDKSPYARSAKNRAGATDSKLHKNNTKGVYFDDFEEEELFYSVQASERAPKDHVHDMSLKLEQLKHRYDGYSNGTIKSLWTMDMEKINFDLIVGLLEWIVSDNNEFEAEGAILVFMPGFAEIQTLFDSLTTNSNFKGNNKRRFKIIPLHSTLSSEDQNAVFRKPPDGVTKIVIATNIAETSITIDDIVYVVDAGKMKEKRYDQSKSMESLDTVWVTKANALQRRGRAGRVQDGICFHLFTSHHFEYHLKNQPVPEIQRAPLEQIVLKIKMLPAFSDNYVEDVLYSLIEPPSQEAIDGAVKRLQDLGALDDKRELTALGHHLGCLPVDVRIGKLMLFGAIFRCIDSALTLAAAMSFKTPFVSPFGLKQEADEKKREFAMGHSDYLTILNAYKSWTELKGRGSNAAYRFCQDNYLSMKTLQMLSSLKQQYVELLSDIGFIQSGIRLRDVERAARNGSDGVAEIVGQQSNVNSGNWKVMSAMLVAALYPNIVQVLTPETRYHESSVGAIRKAPSAEELRFKTKLDGYVSIHPSSVNFQVKSYPSPYLVYHEKVKTTKVYIRDCSMVSVYQLLLFGGGSINIDLHRGDFVMAVDDGWIKFMASSPQVAGLVRDLRYELDQLLWDKITQPELDLLTCPAGNKVINCIVNLISTQ